LIGNDRTQAADGGTIRERPRVAFLTPLPTPYRQPLLEKLVETADADIVVYYFAASEADRSWQVPIPQGDSRFRVLPGKSLSFMGKKSFINHWNSGLWRELDKGRYDLVIIPGYALLSSQSAILWAWVRGKAYVIHSESHLAEPRSWMRRAAKAVFVRRVVSRAAACLATGTLSKEYLCSYGARSEDVFFFPNTPDVEWFVSRSDELRPRREVLRRKWGMGEGPAIIFVGRLLQVKGVDILLRAFSEVLRAVPNAQLVIVGDGPLEADLRKLAAALGVEERAHFVGFHQREELVELYVCADIFCLPSRHEPWGVVVNEAAACGLPLVVSDRVGAGRDLVRAGDNGFVVPAEDVEALRSGIERLLSNSQMEGMPYKASRDAAHRWNYDLAVEQFQSMLRRVQRRGYGS